MFITVTSAIYLDNFQIECQFSDGKLGIVDLLPFLQGPVFEPLRNIETFKRFSIDPDLETIVWENRADFAPEFLYFHSFKNDSSLRSQFVKWGYLAKDEIA